MPNETPEIPPATLEVNASRPGLFRRHWGKLALGAIVLIPALGFTIWAGLAMNFTYSSGDRVGFVQKLAKKGWVCKTWEGEMQLSNVPGSAPTIFYFSVRGDSIAQEIVSHEGRQMSLHYNQHVGVPTSCFGDTEYFITGVRVLEANR
ncbi:MAG: hypothetical protein U0132_16270 [Gemmatimonadaceae bacterium]